MRFESVQLYLVKEYNNTVVFCCARYWSALMVKFDFIDFLAGGENGHRVNGQLSNDIQNSDQSTIGKSTNYQKSKFHLRS